MAKKCVFVSFDFDNDKLRGSNKGRSTRHIDSARPQ